MEPNADLIHATSARSAHPSEEILENYALGRLPESESDTVETHLLTCTSCQEALTETDDYVAAMKAALKERNMAPEAAPQRVAGMLDWLRDQMRHPHPLTAFSMGVATLAMVAAVSYQVSEQPVPESVTLRSVRGGSGAEAAEAPAGVPLVLAIQSAEWQVDASFRVRIVDAAGREAWQGAPVMADGRGVARVDRLGAGAYWVRLYGPTGGLLQEYGLRVR